MTKQTPKPKTKTSPPANKTTSPASQKHSSRYQAVKAKINSAKDYPLKKAVKLAKAANLCRFDAPLQVHINTTLAPGKVGDIKLPYFKGKTKKIAIANEATVKSIKAGKIDFDVLLASPAQMPQLLPLAKILGPKGLMPNPKNGTLTDNPQAAAKNFTDSNITISTEKKAPLIHTTAGLLSQPDKELIANLEAIIKLINPQKITKMVVCSTMGPAVKVKLE